MTQFKPTYEPHELESIDELEDSLYYLAEGVPDFKDEVQLENILNGRLFGPFNSESSALSHKEAVGLVVVKGDRLI